MSGLEVYFTSSQHSAGHTGGMPATMVMAMDNDGDAGDADSDVVMVAVMAMICFKMLSLPPGSLP